MVQALTVQLQPRIVHAVLIEIGQDLVGVKRPRRREQHLIQMRGQPNAGRVTHGIQGASFLVFEGLYTAQKKKRRSRMGRLL